MKPLISAVSESAALKASVLVCLGRQGGNAKGELLLTLCENIFGIEINPF